MRRLLLALAFLPLAACSSPCGTSIPTPPTISFRWPLALDNEPTTIAGPRLMAVPAVQYVAPSYTAVQSSACGCGPAAMALPPGYVYSTPAPNAQAPCGGNGGIDQGIPAVRR